jgi:glucose/arabinose dehydrogenase
VRARLVLALLAVALALPASAAADPRLTPVGTFSAPVYLTAPPGDRHRLFVVEKGGLVKVIVDGGAPTTFLDISSEMDTGSEEGLLSIAFAPDYATSGRLYAFYNVPDPAMGAGSVIKVAEFQRSASNPNAVDPAARRVLLSIPHPTHQNHNGGQLQFGPDGLLYVSTGDGGSGNDPDDNGQDKRSLLGKLLRIDPTPSAGAEYTIPPGNPFADGTGGAPEIFAYGLRNPWRFSFDRETGDLTIGDVGQGSREEIEFEPRGTGAGANYGWRCYEGTTPTPGITPACEPPGHFPPVFEYDSNAGFCSITGGYVVRDPDLPTLRGRYLYGDFCSSSLHSIVLAKPSASGNRVEPLAPPGGQVVGFGEDSCGHVYVVQNAGAVSRIDDEPFTPCPDPPAGGGTPGGGTPGGGDPGGGNPGGGTGQNGDGRAPSLKVSRARRQRLLRNKAVYFGVSCDEACSLATEANARLAVSGKTRKWAFPAVTRSLAAGERPRLRLRLSKAMRAGLARRVAQGAQPLVKVVVIARDEAGNVTRSTVYVRVVG